MTIGTAEFSTFSGHTHCVATLRSVVIRRSPRNVEGMFFMIQFPSCHLLVVNGNFQHKQRYIWSRAWHGEREIREQEKHLQLTR